MRAWLGLALLLLGCKSEPTPAREGEKCFYGDLPRGPCAAGLFCKARRGADGQPEMEKVGLDKTIAVGDCRAPIPLGKPCEGGDQCAEGTCLHPSAGSPGTCNKL